VKLLNYKGSSLKFSVKYMKYSITRDWRHILDEIFLTFVKKY